jgi:hypothetical protein
MAVPDYQSVMLPLLRFAEERKTEISTEVARDTSRIPGDAIETIDPGPPI